MTALAVDVRIACKHCPAVAGRSVTQEAARFLGWRFFDGLSMTGKPLSDVVCPTCAGTAEPVAETGEPPGWRVRCNTCHWEYEDEYGDGPLSPKEARDMARDHQCEAEVEIAPADGDKWYDEYQVKDDGSIDERFVR